MKKFFKWLANEKKYPVNPKKEKLFVQLKTLWQLSSQTEIPEPPETRQAWMKLKREIILADNREKLNNYGWNKFLNPRLAFVAGFSIVVLFAVGLFIFRPDLTVYKTSGNNQLSVLLPDSSSVQLNHNSYIHFEKGYGKKERQVHLTGEAFFEVKHMPQSPFIVQAQKSAVQVLGTSFNVNSDEQAGVTKVTVVTGKVKFYQTKNEHNVVELIAGDCALFNNRKATITKYKNEDLNFLSWKTGVLKFVNTPMKAVITELSQHYNKKIVVKTDLIWQNKLTSVFNNQSIEQVMEEICQIFKVHYKIIDENTVHIYS